MRWMNLLFCLLMVILSSHGLSDPYKILGVHRSASLQDIRKAYKQLAKEWHPDKNNDPNAENKFVEINQAYELLTDPERRKNYDNFGMTEPQMRSKRDYSQYRKFDPLDELFGSGFGGFKFEFKDRDGMATFHRLSITTRGYENKLVPKSYRVPHLLMFYSDWCFACVQVEPVWRKIMEDLEPLGVGIASIHAENEQLLVRKVGVSTLPSLAVLIDGKPNLFKESVFSKQKIVEFMRSKFPYMLVQLIDDSNVNAFLQGWLDNRVRVLIFDRQETVRLRYLLMAYYYRDRVAFGHVYIKSENCENIKHRFKVPQDIDSLLLFNENMEHPVASLSMTDMPVKTMQDIINSNLYLMLPRLSSQSMFDALCPPEWTRTKKRLCVVLVSQNTPFHDKPRQALRQFVQEGSYNAEKVRFAYIFQEKQTEFINAIASGCPSEPALHIVIIWRRDASHIKYEWLPHSWDTSDNHKWNQTRERLERTIQRLLHDSEALSYEAIVKELIDEHAQGLVSRFLTKLFSTADYLKDNVSRSELLPVLSVIATVIFIIGMAYLMAYLVRMEEEKIQMQHANGSAHGFGNGNCNLSKSSSELRLHELRSETYNGLIRLLKPGCRTIILLVDAESKAKLIPVFHKIVWPYRKNKSLMFGFLCLERGLDWYKQLLTLTLSEPRDLNINPRNCVGTVLSLNGYRRYFCMYHAKHPECKRAQGSKRMAKMTKHISSDPNAKDGAFIGFDSSDSEDTETSDVEIGDRKLEAEIIADKYTHVVFISNLLDGLPNWLDRLFEGTTHRYYINYWPDFNSK